MSEYFLETKSLGKRVKVELDLSNYAIKADLKMVDLAHLESNVDKLDIDKQKNVPANLSNWKR